MVFTFYILVICGGCVLRNNASEDDRILEDHRLLLNSDKLETDWNLYYGLTDNRSKSLLNKKDHKNSFYNSNSENSLTLFVFGNLDDWSQNGNLKLKPRDDRSRWSKNFFDSLRSGEKLYKGSKNSKNLLKKSIESNLDLTGLDMTDSVLLFEFSVMNSSFHGGETFRKLSFLDLKYTNRWVKFDAVLILPSEKLFIFIESKMESDISTSTARYPKVNQIIKGLESAYLLTNHKDSLYEGWDFRYVITCPRVINEYNMTYYNYITKYIGKNLVEYNDLINKEYPEDINESCYPKYFGGFLKEVRDKISMVYWDEITKYLFDQDDNFFMNYLKRVEKNLDEKEKFKAIKTRFKRANLKLT